MANYRLGIEIDATSSGFQSTMRGAHGSLQQLGATAVATGQQTTRALDAVERSGQRVGGTFERLRGQAAGLFAGVAAAAAINAGVRMADSYGEVGARLRNAVGESVNLVGAQQRVFAVAQATRSELGATSALVGTFAKGFRDAGVLAENSLTKALGLTTTINQAIKVSGTSQESALDGLRQLNQGLGAGVLRGDEFNSVMEQTPRLAQAMADGLGVSKAALKQMADEGLLTRDKIVAALEGQADRIAAEYARLPPTVSGAFTVLTNAVTKYLGEANQATGVTRTLAGAITFVAENLSTIGTVVGAGVFAALAIGAGKLVGEFARMNQVRQIGRAFEEASAVNAAKDAAARNVQAAAVLRLAEVEAGRQRGLGLAIGSTAAAARAEDALTTARQRAAIAQAELATAERLAAVGGGLGARVAGWGSSIMAFLGGPFGLLTAGLIALPLLFSALSSPADTSATSIEGLTAQLNALNVERERSAQIQDGGQGLAQQSLEARAAALQRIATLEQHLANQSVDFDRASVAARRSVQQAIDDERGKLELLDQALARNFVSTNQYAGAAVDAFQRAAQGGFGFVAVLDRVQQGWSRLFNQAVSADFGSQFAALQKDVEKAVESSRNSVLTLQGKIPLVEEFKRLAAAATAAGKTVPKELQAMVDQLIASEAAEKRLTSAAQAGAVARKESTAFTKTFNAGLAAFNASVAEAAQKEGVLDGAIQRSTRALSARDAVLQESRTLLAALTKLRGDEQVDQVKLERAIDLVTKARDRELAALDRRADVGGRLLQQLDDEVRLSGLSARDREIEQRLLQATQQGYIGNTAALRGDIAARLDQIEVNRALQAQAAEYRSTWTGAISSVSDAFGDFVSGGIKSFSDFRDQIGNIARRLMSDLISQFARRIILNLGVNAQGGGTLGSIGNLFGGGGGGSFLDSLGSLFGGSGAPGGGRGSSFVGPLQPGQTAPAGFSAGQALGVAGGAYGVYQAYRSGSPVSGALSGAMAGTAILPGIGTIIGGVVGALAGIFGGEKAPDIRVGAQGQTRKPEQSFATSLGTLTLGARGLEGGERAFIPQIQKFDETMLAIVSSFGDGTAQLQAVRGRLATWAVDLKGDAATAEGVLGSRFNAILSTFSSSVQSFVGTSGDLATRTQRLADAGFLEAAAASGDLLGSFDALVDVLDDVKIAGESVTDTYGRVHAGFNLLNTALDFVGVSIGGTQEQLVRFSEAFVTAAGGLQQAQALWDSFYTEFYTAEERAAAALERAKASRAKELADIGLDAGISNEEFKQRFLAALPTLTPQQVKEWLEAGAAISAANAAQRGYNETLGETVDDAQAAKDALAGIFTQVADFESGLNASFERLRRSGLTETQRALLEVNDELQGNVATLQRMRAAAVAAGASAAELARIDGLLSRAHQLAAEQALAIIENLRGAGRSLVDQLYGTGGAGVGNAAQQLADAGVSAFGQIGEAASNVYQSQLSSLKTIQQWLDSQRLGNLSTLTPAGRLDEAQAQFNATLALARGGDADALGRITGLADALLTEGRGMFASGQQYTDLEAAVRAALQGLVARGPVGAAGPGAGPVNGPGTGFGNTIAAATNEFGQQAQSNRLELAQQLSANVAALINATREPLAVVAASIGLNVGRLVADLGVNLSALTGSTTAQLGNIAGSLGVELSELAQNVGVDLGDLADRQSLINDALEAEIAKLPQDQRDKLQPLLDAVEASADDPQGLKDAKIALQNAINDIGGKTRNALAPYFDDIDPTDPLDDMNDLLRGGFGVGGFLDRIATAVELLNARGGGTIEPVVEGSFAVGTPFVPRDMLAQIHAGEAVIDASTMASLRRYGIPVSGGGSGSVSDDVAAAIRTIGGRIESRLVAVETAVRAGASLTAGAVTESIGDLAATTDFNNGRSAARRTR